MSGFRSLGDHETVEFKASNTDKVCNIPKWFFVKFQLNQLKEMKCNQYEIIFKIYSQSLISKCVFSFNRVLKQWRFEVQVEGIVKDLIDDQVLDKNIKKSGSFIYVFYSWKSLVKAFFPSPNSYSKHTHIFIFQML